MFKFKVNKNQQSNTEIAKSVEDFFTFSKIATLGFPYKPTTLTWDPFLHLMAIGTQHGLIRIYGAPGVQFCAELRQKISITDLIFIPKKARLISLCTDNSLHLWELNEKNGIWCLEEIKSFVLTGLTKKITAILLSSSSDILYMGTMCGNIYTLNVETFEMAESVIYQDVVVQNIPDDKKLKQGSVKVISSHPVNSDCLLIGYQQGLIALWDIKKLVVISTFISSQSLESVAWQHHGIKFMSSHSDGSYVTWNTEDSSKPAEVPMTPYVFRLELIAIRRYLQFACETEVQFKDVWILTDNYTSVQHLSNWTSKVDQTSFDILNLLNWTSSNHHLHFQWVLSHMRIDSNEKADLLARTAVEEG
ncbi:LLGL scribble cell polarity complex component 2 [Trichonephila clavipes]|nr:LLGL scribble cell polarity complex component 2 [Trichonephila clavipes]